jgi:hypothetical protein
MTPNRLDQNRTTPQHIIIKTISTENKERTLKAVREKTNTKGNQPKSEFSMETLIARRAWSEVF